ncbi:ATP-binding protein [Priestia megaterium]|uniref:ATP-binding protein n=1 Tax=Priestia megaterium TaxID=1404 RepID=UPI001C4488BC|nr:sensor histidine kinase [Priestia megaterium]MBV6734920.1 sensor histidine kinase [Priestia megaterium]
MRFPNVNRRPSLLAQITLLITVVILVSTVLVCILFSAMIDEIVEKYVGKQAMTVAKLASEDKMIVKAFKNKNPSEQIQPAAEKIRKTTGADYVTIANDKGIRHSHPNSSYIGKHTKTSNEASLKEHQSIIYKGKGISGFAIKAKTPIWDSRGNVIGVSSVGFLVSNIEKQINDYRIKIIKLSCIPFLIGAFGAFFIARRVKRLIFGLEPEEISFLFKEKEATLESIRDATVTVNVEKYVTSMNRRARELFGHLQIGGEIKNARLGQLIDQAIEKQRVYSNQSLVLDGQQYILDLSPIVRKKEVQGIVLTIRTLSQIEELTEEISKIKMFSDSSRAQNHEFLNKLNVIYGLLKLKKYEHVMQMISSEVKERQDIISFLMSSVKDPLIAACLLGKINRSKELDVTLEIDQDSNLTSTLDIEDAKNVVSILGNLIDNALEAVREHKGNVLVSFTDVGNDLIFEVEDNGQGISKEVENMIFIDGYTTKKGENHGIGLTIVKRSVELLKGELYISKSMLQGARFTLVIPKLLNNEKEESI